VDQIGVDRADEGLAVAQCGGNIVPFVDEPLELSRKSIELEPVLIELTLRAAHELAARRLARRHCQTMRCRAGSLSHSQHMNVHAGSATEAGNWTNGLLQDATTDAACLPFFGVVSTTRLQVELAVFAETLSTTAPAASNSTALVASALVDGEDERHAPRGAASTAAAARPPS
jgi:hypothetical protein